MSRICRAHDADDPVLGRICGRPMPCADHPRGCGAVRLRPSPQPRNRERAIFTLSKEAREWLREQDRPASRVVEDLISAARRGSKR